MDYFQLQHFESTCINSDPFSKAEEFPFKYYNSSNQPTYIKIFLTILGSV